MNSNDQNTERPIVRLAGDYDHPDFRDAVARLRADADVVETLDVPPELIVIAQSRPGLLSVGTIESLRRGSPSAPLIALLGTWCEGETRTGRPWPNVKRLYWYEFLAWWQRQLALRSLGAATDCATHGVGEITQSPIRNPKSEIRHSTCGLIVVNTPVRETAAALADILTDAGYATLWQLPGRQLSFVRGATAGIWDGGQLDKREEKRLADFCKELARDMAPVIALLDFPRRDRSQRARELGATAILGKPWLNDDLVATLVNLIGCRQCSDDCMISRAA